MFIFAEANDLIAGIHSASIFEVVSAFGTGSSRRVSLALRLKRIYELVSETRHLRRFVLFGSFVTRKVAPNDIDIFLIMENAFDVTQTEGHTRSVFDRATAQAEWYASVFWSRQGALGSSEEDFMAHLQIKRDGSRRGIVEIISE